MLLYFAIYLFIMAVVTLSILERWTWTDVIASVIVSLLWPVFLPARLLRKVLALTQ